MWPENIINWFPVKKISIYYFLETSVDKPKNFSNDKLHFYDTLYLWYTY